MFDDDLYNPWHSNDHESGEDYAPSQDEIEASTEVMSDLMERANMMAANMIKVEPEVTVNIIKLEPEDKMETEVIYLDNSDDNKEIQLQEKKGEKKEKLTKEDKKKDKKKKKEKLVTELIDLVIKYKKKPFPFSVSREVTLHEVISHGDVIDRGQIVVTSWQNQPLN